MCKSVMMVKERINLVADKDVIKKFKKMAIDGEFNNSEFFSHIVSSYEKKICGENDPNQ